MLTPVQISNATNRCLQRLADIGKDMVRKEKHGEVVNDLYDEGRYLSLAYKVLNSNHGLTDEEIQKIVECMTKKGNLNKNYSVVSITLATNTYLATQGYITSITFTDSADIDFTASGTTAMTVTGVLTTTGVSAGSSYNTFTVDSKGRITAASTIAYVAVGATAGGALAGTYPNPTIKNMAVERIAFGSATAGELDSDTLFRYEKSTGRLAIGSSTYSAASVALIKASASYSFALTITDSSNNYIASFLKSNRSVNFYGSVSIGPNAANSSTGLFIESSSYFNRGIQIGSIYDGSSATNYAAYIKQNSTSGTNFYGLYLDQGAGATNIYGICTGDEGLNGFGTFTPTARLHVKGAGATSATSVALFENSSGTQTLKMYDDNTITHFDAVNRHKFNINGTQGLPTTNVDGIFSIQATPTTTSALRFGVLTGDGGWIQAGAINVNGAQSLKLQPIGGRVHFFITTDLTNAAFQADASNVSGVTENSYYLLGNHKIGMYLGITAPNVTTTNQQGQYISVTGAGTNITNQYGLYITNTSGALNNIGLHIDVSGATTTNYAAKFISGRIAMTNLQVGNTGLASGDLYKDTAANILTNGDYVIGMKA